MRLVPSLYGGFAPALLRPGLPGRGGARRLLFVFQFLQLNALPQICPFLYAPWAVIKICQSLSRHSSRAGLRPARVAHRYPEPLTTTPIIRQNFRSSTANPRSSGPIPTDLGQN